MERLKHTVRLSLEVSRHVEMIAEVWGIPFARVMRTCIEMALEDPDRVHEVLGRRYGAVPDSSTPEQRQRANEYLANLEPHDWGKMVGRMID